MASESSTATDDDHEAMAAWHRENTLKMLARYRRPDTIPRPSEWPSDDLLLVEQVASTKTRVDRRKNATKEDGDFLADFGAWRTSVALVEERTMGTTLLLLTVLRHFIEAGYHAEEVELRRFMGIEYGLVSGWSPSSDLDLQRMAEHLSRARCPRGATRPYVLSDLLMRGYIKRPLQPRDEHEQLDMVSKLSGLL